MSKDDTVFTVYAPPHVGNYKLEIFAARVPKTKGVVNLPVVATFMVQVKLNTKESESGEFPSRAVQKHKLASIAEAFEVPSDSASSGGMYPSPRPEKCSEGIFSGLNLRGSNKSHELLPLFSGKKKKKGKTDSDSRPTSVFSISSFISRKFSMIPDDDDDGRQ